MHFISIDYIVFLLAVLGVYHTLASRRLQNALLLVASFIFYGWIHPWFLILLLFTAILDFLMGQMIEVQPAHKRRWLFVSMAGNLGLLGIFKYYDFFVHNVAAVLGAVGLSVHPATLGVLLPAGISFYTFQTMSYTIDVYLGKLKARRDLLDYLVYVSYFPQLVAGPIERAEHLLPQVEAPRRTTWHDLREGVRLVLWGAFKKVCIADAISPYVDKTFALDPPHFTVIYAACFAFGVQIYADFSGYTDIARGSAKLMGFELIENFRKPYAATSTPDFWRRWHISLSTWIGDYVYTPLLRRGRPSALHTVWATLVTFLLIGLWHGASWNFVLLGLFHGVWMSLYLLGTPLIPLTWRSSRAGLWLAWAFHTFIVLQPTALLFREHDVSRLWSVWASFGSPMSQDQWVLVTILVTFALLGSVPLHVGELLEFTWWPKVRHKAWLLPIETTVWALEIVAIAFFYRDMSQDFVYFEF